MATEKKNTALLIGIAGVAGLGVFLAVRKNSQVERASKIAALDGKPVAKPGVFDSLLGNISDVMTQAMQRAAQLEAKIKARGEEHYKAWKDAVKRVDPMYALEDPSGASQCFETKTGNKAPLAKCISTSSPGLLEGYL